MLHDIDPGLLADGQRDGLTTAEAADRREWHGANDILPPMPSGVWRLLAASLSDPMLWFLVVSAGLFALVGERSEAVVLLVAIAPLFGMDAFLHGRTQTSTAALAARLADTVEVVRDGVRRSIDSRELVPGDRVLVSAGNWVPADGVLIAGDAIQLDESALTGESLPVRKQPLSDGAPAGNTVADRHWLSAGTRLLTGEATLLVAATGAATLYGELARSAQAVARAATPLQRAIRRLTAVLLAVALALCVLLAVVRLWQGFGLVDAVLAAITLAVAALPEEFPLVFAAFLGVGVYRLARRRALVRRAVAVENIGRVTCICTDKTGTLTEGRVQLSHVVPADGVARERLLRAAAGASGPDTGDPVDAAIAALAGSVAAAVTFPFSEARRRQVGLVDGTDGRHAVMKGAPETVLARCVLPADAAVAWRERIAALAAEGHKMLACAERRVASDAIAEPGDGYAFLGLLAFEDPLRAGVADAVAAARRHGIRVIMLTGDHPATAVAIATELGLGEGLPSVREGDAVVADDAPLPDVVARCLPAQKLVLVQRLQGRGERVAVTGDGINDVPAIRAADVGIAMGERGTRAAREAAAIVLLDDDFSTLVRAVAEGRQLFANLRASFAFLLVVHIPLVLTAALLPLAGQPLPYLPVVIVLLELAIHPLALLAFQQAAGDTPSSSGPAGTRIFHRGQVAWLLVGGLLATLAVTGGWFMRIGEGVGPARSTVAGLLIALAVGSAAGLSGLRGALTRRVIAAVAAGGFGMLLWPPAAALLNVAAPGAEAIVPFAAMTLAATVLGTMLRGRPVPWHR
ncbi:HAD-IC family P-type ATPase [Pseudoxanthomonas mexicana]|uniref:cation-translocating P-type ATPase n=1 Tax=Pseudoxanthomonas mexicana TaxID=128785 RepID=UPI001FD718A1|nr:HAD-IC family P-type ATPase [Pseudoxanthomonas mexicana]UOV05514.1 HAD-IC family P-type ATPase [Pseudoxanthomonas mexicana]